MTRAVLDVNVFISALIAPLGIPKQLWRAWRRGQFQLVTSDPIITTTTNRLRLPRIATRYQVTEAHVCTFAALLHSGASVVPILPEDITPVTGDPEDDAVLATVRVAEAEYLVTGDRGLLALGAYAGARIITPRVFLAVLSR